MRSKQRQEQIVTASKIWKQVRQKARTYFPGGNTEPAATELLSQSTLSMKVFTAHPYKNLVVWSWDKHERIHPRLEIKITKKSKPCKELTVTK